MEQITYLVTNFNNSKYIGECLQSIIDQTNTNWSCLVIDDASTDNSVEIIRSYVNDKLKLFQNDQNIDQVRSLQRLIDMSESDIVAIIDSDDAIERNTTYEVLNAFSKSKKIGFVYTNCTEYDENLAKPVSVGLSARIPFGPTSSIIYGHPCHLRCFRKSVYYKTAGYNLDLLYAEDLDLGYKLEEVCLPYFLNSYLYKHRKTRDTRGRKIENKVLGYKNRWIAKRHAIKRRGLRGYLWLLCEIYVYLEYVKCVSAKKKRKIVKFISFRFLEITKNIIHNVAFKSIDIK